MAAAHRVQRSAMCFSSSRPSEANNCRKMWAFWTSTRICTIACVPCSAWLVVLRVVLCRVARARACLDVCARMG
eukprot:997519-Alexandrium_andersonii.AAC.1